MVHATTAVDWLQAAGRSSVICSRLSVCEMKGETSTDVQRQKPTTLMSRDSFPTTGLEHVATSVTSTGKTTSKSFLTQRLVRGTLLKKTRRLRSKEQ